MADYDVERGELDFLDIIALLSFDLGMQNLALNQIQVDGLMREMTENQDGLLKKISEQNEQIINLLKELKNGTHTKNNKKYAERIKGSGALYLMCRGRKSDR